MFLLFSLLSLIILIVATFFDYNKINHFSIFVYKSVNAITKLVYQGPIVNS